MADSLDYSKTHRYQKLFLDYIHQRQSVDTFYKRFPKPENFQAQIEDKKLNYNNTYRQPLVEVLKEQYRDLSVSKKTIDHIALLSNPNTFTITTGHQLNLFGGPLYTFYKIISVINSCRHLKKEYPKYNFVPIFWLASEDHDFEEINHFFFKNKKVSWPKKASGAVGEFDTKGLRDVFCEFENLLPGTKTAECLLKLFKESYLENKSLSKASIYLYNQLFGEEGLVILEPNHPNLKACFKAQIKDELFHQKTSEKVTKTTNELLDKGYHQQVTPREINLFYKTENSRERLIYKDGNYFVSKTKLQFSAQEIEAEIDSHPERFSPNALLRPLYQEVLLPNLSYVGGAGELAYWLQLKSTFEYFGVTFPMLQMRNSALLVSKKSIKKLNKLDIKLEDLFQEPIDLKNQFVEKISEVEIDFSPQKRHLSDQFENLYKLAEKTDKSFLNAVAAQEKKQHNGLDKLEKRLLKAQRKKLEDETERLAKLQNKLFPDQNLQERYVNFSELYLSYGKDFIFFLLENLDPFDFEFSLLVLESQPKGLNQTHASNCV